MASGFSVSMLLLSLIAFGLLAVGNAYRDGYKSLGPYSAQAETLPRSYRPGPSGYEASLQPRTSMAGSKLPGSLTAETFKPVASKGQGGYSRQVSSYSQPGSVPSYRSASAINPQQQPQASVSQWKPRTREPSSSQGEKRYGSSIVSSGAIEIYAPENPPQLQSSSPGVGGLKTKPGMWDNIPASQIPNLHPAFSVPAVLQTNAGMWDSVKAQSAKAPDTAARSPLENLPFSAPAVVQTKAGMWDSVKAQSAKSPDTAARRPLQNLAFSAPSMRPAKADRWRSVFVQGAKAPDSTARHEYPLPVPSVLKTSPGHLQSFYTSSAVSPDFTSQRHEKPSSFPAPAVLQSKHGMWGSVFSPESNKNLPANPRSSRPQALSYYSSRLPSGLSATQQQAKLASQPTQLGSPSSFVLQNKAVLKDVYSNPQTKHDPRSSRPVNMASPYQQGSQQLSYNRN